VARGLPSHARDGRQASTAKRHSLCRQLETNLQSLLARFRSGTYRAPPVRRVWIPKGSGNETRPIGIPTFEDKVLQRAVLMLLEPIFEADFDAGSYGFRPGRSTHQAIAAMETHDGRAGHGFWKSIYASSSTR
jgi:retron-type reverse transcriptase